MLTLHGRLSDAAAQEATSPHADVGRSFARADAVSESRFSEDIAATLAAENLQKNPFQGRDQPIDHAAVTFWGVDG